MYCVTEYRNKMKIKINWGQGCTAILLLIFLLCFVNITIDRYNFWMYFYQNWYLFLLYTRLEKRKRKTFSSYFYKTLWFNLYIFIYYMEKVFPKLWLVFQLYICQKYLWDALKLLLIIKASNCFAYFPGKIV